jgi:hypothetical protein
VPAPTPSASALSAKLYDVMDDIQHDWNDLSRVAPNGSAKAGLTHSLLGCRNEIADLMFRLGAGNA